MQRRSRAIRPFLFCAIVASTVLAMRAPAPAQATLEARYGIWFARLPVGETKLSIDIGIDRYSATTTANASGVVRVVASGEASAAVAGTLADDRLSPVEFNFATVDKDERIELSMMLAGGNVTAVKAKTPPAVTIDRVAVTAADMQGVVDPLSALLIPAGPVGDSLDKEACHRTLPVFDGRRRFDLALSYKRIDKVKTDKGYAGEVLVCAVAFKPIAGHRKDSRLVKYLSGGREIELAFAPIVNTRVLAPYRLSVSSWIGNLVIEATRFEATAKPAVPPPPIAPRSPGAAAK